MSQSLLAWEVLLKKRIFQMKPSLVRLSLGIVVPLLLSLLIVKLIPKETAMTSTSHEIFGVRIHKNPPQSKLAELGVSTWPKYESGPTKIPWSFEAEETMYLLQGKVKVTVEGSDGSFEIGGGDLAVFPKGVKITWEVIEAVKKHYSLKK